MSNLQIYRASAGSGKTHILTQEYLKLAFVYPEKFKRILAVTFTNKAAEEMKERIIKEINNLIIDGSKSAHYEAISSVIKNYSEKQIQQRALDIRNGILHNYSQFSISTIDSFVQKVIRSFAYEINIPTGYKIEMDYEKVVSDITDLLYNSISRNNELQKWLIQFAKYKIVEGKNWDFRDEIYNLTFEIFKERFQSFENEENKNNKNTLNELLSEVIKIKNSFEPRMIEIGKKAENIIDNYAINANSLGRNFKTITTYLTSKITDKKEYEPGATVYKALEGLENWHAKTAKKDIVETISSVYFPLNECLKEAVNLYENEFTLYISAYNILSNFHSFGILNDISDVLPEYRDENNLLLISDSTLLLKKIIDNNDAPFIYEKVGTKYQNILIDEFQDTSGFQWHNFKPLIENSISQGEFNLIVGDIKQSIYRWRGGDWRLLLNQVENDLGSENINVKTLGTNWRSKKNIINFNNIIFYYAPKILQQKYNAELETILDVRQKERMTKLGYDRILIDAYSDSYQNISPQKSNSGGRVMIEFVKSDRKEIKTQWKEKVKTLLPQTIENLLQNKNYSPKDITILVRKNKEGQEVVNMLLEYQNTILDAQKYQIISSESLFISNSTAVRLIISATKFIFDQSDTINLAALVYEYSKLIGNQENMHEIFDSKNKTTLQQFLPEEFVNQIETLRKYSIFELIETLISFFGLNTYEEQFSYLRTLQDSVLEFTRNEYSDIEKFIEWWDDKGNKISIQLSDKQDAVTIMTIHKSKGLAFKVVIIPFCNWEIDHNPFVAPIIWCKTENEPFTKFNFLPVKYKKELAQTVFQQDYFDEKLYSQMDALNMLYVAFTRSEEELIIFAPTDESDKMSTVSDILYNTIKISSENFTENDKEYISLKSYYSEDGKLSIDEDYKEIETEKLSEKKAENIFELKEYPNFDWREKIALKSHADDFFIKSIQYIEDKVNYGILMHEILSKINVISDVDEVITEMRSLGKIDFEDIDKITANIKKIISLPIIKDWFSDKYQIKTESEILTSKGEIKIPDRILFSEKEVIVIDFKFGEIRLEYEEQVREYMQIVSEIEPDKKINGYIYYADKAKLVEISGQRKLF